MEKENLSQIHHKTFTQKSSSQSNSPFSSSLSQYFEEGDLNMLLSQRSKFYPQGKPSKISLLTKREE